ncbi:MAG TPA: ATP-binding protein [Burkholderiales bacterium]
MTDLSATTVAEPSAPLLGRRFDRLRVKLFLAIAGANAVLAIVAYLLFALSFERGFIDYLHRGDVAKLDALVASLAQDYERQGSWDAIVNDRDNWAERSREALNLPARPDDHTNRAAVTPASPREFPLTIDPRLMLFDAERRLLIGRPERADDAAMKPIIAHGNTVGYLGYLQRTWLFESVARISSAQQHGSFAAIGLGMLGAALLLGAGLAQWLTKRIRALATATAALIQGNYEVRLAAQGHDELDQLARDFNKLAATLAATRRARSQWVADIAHELRTPLSVLRGEIEALQDGVRPLTPDSMTSLAHEVGRLGRLVEDLHLLSMSDLGALTYYVEPVDIAEVIDDVMNAHRRALEERDLQVELQLQQGIVLADAARLAQVFGNLLQNTIRYTDRGGRIAVRVQGIDDRIIVHWEDSSPGVADSELVRLTDRLYRVDGSRSRAGGGSGLGLAIAKAIVEAHHGSMIARSSALGGLWWQLEFPRHG